MKEIEIYFRKFNENYLKLRKKTTKLNKRVQEIEHQLYQHSQIIKNNTKIDRLEGENNNVLINHLIEFEERVSNRVYDRVVEKYRSMNIGLKEVIFNFLFTVRP